MLLRPHRTGQRPRLKSWNPQPQAHPIDTRTASPLERLLLAGLSLGVWGVGMVAAIAPCFKGLTISRLRAWRWEAPGSGIFTRAAGTVSYGDAEECPARRWAMVLAAPGGAHLRPFMSALGVVSVALMSSPHCGDVVFQGLECCYAHTEQGNDQG